MIIDKILQITDRITPSIVAISGKIERLKEIRGENKHIDFDWAPDKECPYS